jgi:hypothetical protein
MPLFYIALAIVVLASALSQLAGPSADARTHAIASAQLPRAFALAEAYAKEQVAAQVAAAGTGPLTVAAPAPMSLAPFCPDGGAEPECQLGAEASFALAGGSAQGPGPEAAPNLQQNASISETWVTMRIAVQVSALAGDAPVGAQAESVTLRLTRTPGYEVTLAGGVTGTADANVGADASRAGCDPANPQPCDPNGAPGAGYDTRIQAQITCGDVGCLATPVPQNSFANGSMTNGNVSGNGWRQ